MNQLKKASVQQHRYCPNCHYPLAKFGEFCSSCGQKFTDGRVPIWVFLHDLTEAIFNIDSKIFNTLFGLFIPGKLTIQFFKGRQKRYATPLRLFLIMAIFHFATVSWFSADSQLNFFGNAVDSDQEQKDAYYELFLDDFDTTKQEVLGLFPEQEAVQMAFDSLDKKLGAYKNDTIQLGYLYWMPGVAEFKTQDLKIAKVDIFTKTSEEVLDTYDIKGFFPRLQVQQFIRIVTDGKSFSNFVLGKLIWMVALMMPALAFILKILYIRRKRYFVEHLVFSFHYHAFAFLIFGLVFVCLKASLLGYISWFPKGEVVIPITFAGVMIYLYLAMKRVYRQGYFKTFIKYCILNLSYLIIFILFLILTFAISALLF